MKDGLIYRLPCKLNKVNPRDYFKDIVHAIHEKRDIFTPNEYLKMKEE